MTETFVPKNEQGVIYLFSRYHEKLGFEKIIQIGTRFPDVIAVRDNKHISIELEFRLSGVRSHYLAREINFLDYNITDPSGNLASVMLTWVYDKDIKAWRPTPIPWSESPEKAEEYIKSYRLNIQDTPNPESMKKTLWLCGLTTTLSRRVPDEQGDMYESGDLGKLYYKSLKPLCDIVICWEIDCELDDPDIEIIELKSVLEITE